MLKSQLDPSILEYPALELKDTPNQQQPQTEERAAEKAADNWKLIATDVMSPWGQLTREEFRKQLLTNYAEQKKQAEKAQIVNQGSIFVSVFFTQTFRKIQCIKKLSIQQWGHSSHTNQECQR